MTAVLIAINQGMLELEENRRVNVKKIVRRLRKDLAGAVRTVDQYKFIHEVCYFCFHLI